MHSEQSTEGMASQQRSAEGRFRKRGRNLLGVTGLCVLSALFAASALSAFSASSRQNPPQQPPTTAKPEAQKAEAPPPAPFPEGAKVAYVFMQGIFNGSADGKAAAARVQEFEKKKTAEIQAKVKEGEALQAKVNQGGTVLNDTARAQAQRDLQRLQREIQAMQEDAQIEGQQLREQLLADFSQKVNPIIAAVAKERALHMVFSVSDQANVAWADPGLDLTQEIIRRVDAASGGATKKE
jgi:outer membrane protein